MTAYITILLYVLAIPASLILPIRFLSWLFWKLEYSFIPFRWREENWNLPYLCLHWWWVWLAFWIWWFLR